MHTTQAKSTPMKMKKFAIRDVETVKTTAAALYIPFFCGGGGWPF